MARPHRSTARWMLAILLSLALGLPLRAQLNPTLQGSSTDFLDLYQQGNINVKPEIVTVFDFSGSMQSLMYHPSYYNQYLDDNGVTNGITFQLSGLPGSFVVTATVGPSSWGYTTTKLIRPDGSLVTEANIDAYMTSQTPHLWGDKNDTGGSSWACDVRNWVRSASHIRLTSGGRTIDLPIPWKVMDINSTGYPLSSMTVLDQYNGLNDQGVPTTYGSGQNIEIDTRYKIQFDSTSGLDQTTIDNNMVLSGLSNQVVTRTKYMLRLNQFYLNWLFTGKYQSTDPTTPDYNPALAGQYIVFDAASLTPNGTAVGLQTRVNQGQGFGTFNSGEDAQKALALPGRDRVQAVKEAAIRTWITYQTRVFWAFRFLDDVGEAGNDGHNNATATTINNNSATTHYSTGVPTTWTNGKDTGWTLFNGNSVGAMNRLAALFPYTNTPLCYATARALAQFTDPNNVFGTVETGTDAPVACQKHFLILFTDGVPTVDNNSENWGTSPYIYTTDSTGSTGDAQTGNTALMANTSNINPGSTWWNIFTYAGAAAHLADTTKQSYTKDLPITTFMAVPASYPSGQASPSSFLPFAIPKRLTQTISAPYDLVTTMTIGVSLGGKLTSLLSPKRRLFLAAAVGDPNRTSWNLNNLTNYTLQDPNNPSLGKTSNSTYFFDATNPTLLTQSLGYAFAESTGGGQTGTTSNTNLPFVGSAVGNQIYIGKFMPPVGGDVLWGGDLLMFPTKVDSNQKTVILDKTGNPIGTNNQLSSTTAVWSVANNLPLWKNRNLKTRLPNASALSSFTYTGTAYTDSSVGLKNFVATDNPTGYPAGGAAQQNLIQMLMGVSPTDSTKNRPDIMGDIIDSAPSYLEYNTASLPASLSVTSGSRFRIILVGTNQGWLHAFGETSTTSLADDPTSTTTPKAKISLVSATVQELWAFMPTDFLPYLDYLNIPTNSHKFMVDGSPSIYFLDLPPAIGGAGNNMLDGANVLINNPATDTTHERAIAIIGLRKGGRSYYALNLHDPTAPTLQWSLVPDEASQITSDRNETGLALPTLQGIVGNMGYSTCAPSFGRILFNGVYRDAVFFGGGLSLPEIEAKFTGAPLMGRSVLALDVNNGHFLAAVDLTSSLIGGGTSSGGKTMIGPISAGVIPFEFFLGSGMAQRAYFLDMWGGLWCWGSKQTIPATPFSPYSNFRADTSELQAWSSGGTQTPPYGTTGIRKVYQDQGSTVTASSTTPTTYSFTGPQYTTLPAPFLVGTFPGAGVTYSGGTAFVPPAVGIAMVSGNRNNPLDYGTNNPANTRLTVVFDRQDSRAWGFDTANGPDPGINVDSKLLNAGKWGANGVIGTTLAYGDPSISQGTGSYYLAPSTPSNTKFGYYVTFPDAVNLHYSKGINSPSVAAGSLFYSYFTPTTVDVCTGGTGYTYTNKICDVMNPVVSDVRTGVTCQSGLVDTWFNIASDFTVLGTPGVQQAGTRLTAANSTGVQNTYTDTNTYLGKSTNFYPKPRVWRTIH
jgi:hypothetical protein